MNLNDLIHSGKNEIALSENLSLNEEIILDMDNLTIDGNGHEIDGQGKTQIFYCTGKNITHKNIILKNGYAKGYGISQY